MADATAGADPMTSQYVSPLPVIPVNVVASHEELVRSARDLWAVAVSLLTELTPDKFTTAPWAAGLFTVELPFIMAKLWHLQQSIVVSAHKYLETEALLITVLETIDVPKLFQELSSWAVDLGPINNLPFGIGQHVPPVQILAPENVEIVKDRYAESNWAGDALIRHETYQLPSGATSHWFYLPKATGWGVFDVGNEPGPLLELQKTLEIGPNSGIHYVNTANDELITPPETVLEEIRGLEGTVSVYKLT